MGICGSSEPPPNPNFIDLSHFEVYKVVGRGGFGKVNAVVRRDPLTGEAKPNELLALKRQEKARVMKKQAFLDALWTERNIMAQLKSPFLCSLIHAFQSDTEVFLVMQFMQGGDLRFHMNLFRGPMPEDFARFYAAEIALGLEELHSLNIVYRDLKPENVLLDLDGHIRLSDFGVSEILEAKRRFRTIGRAGTFGYMSPEMLQGLPYGVEVDLWAFGVTIYEMLHGQMPWSTMAGLQSTGVSNVDNRGVNISAHDVSGLSQFRVNRSLSEEARHLMSKLFAPRVEERIGCSPRGMGWADVKSHPWFRTINWAQLAARRVAPPLKPDPNRANCSPTADLQDQLMDFKPLKIPPEDQKHFENFGFNNLLRADLKVLQPGQPVSPTSTRLAEGVEPVTLVLAQPQPQQPQQPQPQQQQVPASTPVADTKPEPVPSPAARPSPAAEPRSEPAQNPAPSPEPSPSREPSPSPAAEPNEPEPEPREAGADLAPSEGPESAPATPPEVYDSPDSVVDAAANPPHPPREEEDSEPEAVAHDDIQLDL